ncbi:hydroxypyruvate isomerase [Aquabacterium commune]|uniref:Hydroxypyruvate isomerase n=1 Tax=Aquabacterium commune TaxID=70586 RepID=A0A4R6R6K4_9BURK|nr:TIM barrel protein [Aquabacterium commune]TDP81305.1 hydroxypyruvate isomerase [Aquabacterium commune]
MNASPPQAASSASPALRFAANLSWLYTDLPFLDRFAAASRDGFAGVECLFPHEHPLAEVQARLRDTGLSLVLFNAEPGHWAAGERGLASLDGRESDFRHSVLSALDRACALGDSRGRPLVHVMAGLCTAPAGSAAHQAAWERFEQRMAWAAGQAQAHGITLTMEPINPRDMPGYLLTRQDEAHGIVQRIGSAHLRVQMDLYHCQIVEGDVTTRLRRWLPTGQIGHLQIAGVPDRNEPDRGELHHPWLFAELQRLGWSGWIGCEYRPRAAPRPDAPGAATTQGLGWRPHPHERSTHHAG